MSAGQSGLLFGHILYAGIPFRDTGEIKNRFCVVVSDNEFNRKYNEVIVAFATSRAKQPQNYDVWISDNDPKFIETGLHKSTKVQCGRLFTLDSRRVIDVVGVVPDNILDDIKKLVLECFEGS